MSDQLNTNWYNQLCHWMHRSTTKIDWRHAPPHCTCGFCIINVPRIIIQLYAKISVLTSTIRNTHHRYINNGFYIETGGDNKVKPQELCCLNQPSFRALTLALVREEILDAAGVCNCNC